MNELISYRDFRFPRDVISHAIWACYRFARCLRDVEDLLAERGIVMTNATIRHWCLVLGCHCSRRVGNHVWYLGEAIITTVRG